jgi:hypothetical protein
MSEPTMNLQEIRQIRKVLEKIKDIAVHVSITGSLRGGGSHITGQYNAVVQHLQQTVDFPPYLLIALNEDASVDEVGVAADILSAFMRAREEEAREETAAEGESIEMSRRRHERHSRHAERGRGIGDIKEVRELKEVGKLIREHLPAFIKGEEGGERSDDELQDIVSEVQGIANELKRADLPEERQNELVTELVRLGREQARLFEERQK